MSNGSEHTPERCVHAVDGPDWAGLREPASWKERAIAAEAENEKHRADLHEWETVGAPAWVAAKDAQLAEVWAERDALQARLDVMTVEWDGEWRTLGQTEDEARKVLMSWTKAQLVNHHVAERQRKVQNENWVADRLASAEAERDALRGVVDSMKFEYRGDPRIGLGMRVSEPLRRRLVGPWTVVPEGDAD
jgi:hypothetical protein